MQTLVYIIGGYCLIKAVLLEFVLVTNSNLDNRIALHSTAALLTLSVIEAFNQ
jgi:hypothetical protein